MYTANQMVKTSVNLVCLAKEKRSRWNCYFLLSQHFAAHSLNFQMHNILHKNCLNSIQNRNPYTILFSNRQEGLYKFSDGQDIYKM